MTTREPTLSTHSRDDAAALRSAVNYEFTGKRAELFKQALTEYPNARRDDFDLMRQHLEPRTGEHILGFGEGSGHFCRTIAEAVGSSGKYVITEPSPELFCNIPQAVLDLPQVFTEITAIQDIDFPPDSFDKAWACGAFHHCTNQTQAMARLHRALKRGGKVVIFDIFQGTPLARHFDTCVARYCETGHEVKFISEEFARTLCILAGFEESKIRIVDIPHRLVFDSMRGMGDFIYKMHAMTRLRGNEEKRIALTIRSLEEHLTIEEQAGNYVLHFDQKGLIAEK
jgi:arsenite methyltransferase